MGVLPGSQSVVFTFGPFFLDPERRLLARDGAPITITPKAFDLLVILVERRGAVVTKDELISALWPDTAVEDGNLAFQISTLRKALGAEGAHFVATLPGRGYQFVEPLQRLDKNVATEAILEEEERTTVTISESRIDSRAWIAAAAVVVLLAIIAGMLVFRRVSSGGANVHSLAVLPFKPLAASQRDEVLEMGMADTLITRLSRMPGVVVRPMSAVRQYSRLEDDPLAAGKSLGVDAVVDGSIQRLGSRIRVTMRVLRTSDGKPIWASQLDEDSNDLFALQDLVAERVARAVAPVMSPAAEAQLVRRTTNDPEAYDLYLKGRYWAFADPVRAEEFYRRAIARDPRFAEAWAALADGWLFRGRYRITSPKEHFEKARQAAIKAVELDPELADGHAALAQVHADLDWDFERAEREYRRALELNPNSDVAHQQYAYLLLFRRDFSAALEHARRATEIDPVTPTGSLIHSFVLDCMGRHDEAIRITEESLRAHPKLVPALLHLGIFYTHAGKPDLAVARLREALAVQPNASNLRALEAFAHAKAGRRETAWSIVRELEERAKKGPISGVNLALALTALGDHDRAFYWLERTYEERVFLLRIVAVLPGYEPLRKDPRYRSLIERLGL